VKPTPEQLEELESEHGKVWTVAFGVDEGVATFETAEHVFVIRRPPRAEWERFEKDCLDPKRAIVGVRNLAIGSIVWPPQAEREEILNEFPGALTVCGNEAASLARGDAAEHAKRFKASTSTLAASR